MLKPNAYFIDGKFFQTEQEAKDFLRDKNATYVTYRLSYGVDTTETGCYWYTNIFRVAFVDERHVHDFEGILTYILYQRLANKNIKPVGVQGYGYIAPFELTKQQRDDESLNAHFLFEHADRYIDMEREVSLLLDEILADNTYFKLEA